MSYIKQAVNEHRGDVVQRLMDMVGHKGGLSLYFLREMCMEQLVEKMSADKYFELTPESCVFHVRIVRQTLRVSAAKLTEILRICDEFGELTFQINGNSLTVLMPKLLKIMDRDSKRARKARAEDATDARLEEEKELDKDLEEEGANSSSKISLVGSGENPLPAVAEPFRNNSLLEPVMTTIPPQIQESWLEEYDPKWLRTTFLKAIGHYLTQARVDSPRQLSDWTTKLSNWLGVEKAPVFRSKPRPPATVVPYVPNIEPVKAEDIVKARAFIRQLGGAGSAAEKILNRVAAGVA
jgi:hypothetical protein